MLKKIYFLQIILSFAFTLNLLAAQDFSLKSSVDKNKLTQGQTLTLKIEISGLPDKEKKIKLPSLEKDFDIVASSQSQSISLNANEKKQVAVFQYVLAPKKSGSLTIGEVEVNFAGRSFKTKPIDIEVLPSQKKPLPSEPAPEEKAGTII